MSSHKLFSFAVLVSLLAVIPGSGYAQSQPAPATQPPSSATPSAPSSSTSTQAQATPIPNAKPGKVWTNDDIGTLREGNSISVVGKNAPQKVSATTRTGPKTLPLEKDPAWYRKQLMPLQMEIEKLDGQIAKLNAFLSGENVSDPPTTHRQRSPTPQDQLKQAEAKRQADAAKMEELLDRARHNGIEPGALR